MTIKTYSTSIDNPFLETFLSSEGWEKSESPLVVLSEIPVDNFSGWQIVTENSDIKNTIVVETFDADNVIGVLDSIAKLSIQETLEELFSVELNLFESLFDSRITSYDEFPLNEILIFLSNWQDLYEFSEKEKVSYFLLSVLDIEVDIRTFEELSNYERPLDYTNILRAHSNQMDLFYCFNDDVEIDGEFKLIFTLLLIYQDQKLEKEQLESYSKSDWEVILNSLSYPTCLISSQGELVLHNSPFTSLGIYAKDCLKFKDGMTLEQNDNVFKVLKEDIRIGGNDFESFIFITDSNLSHEGNLTISSEELGIISGSIAHELNNPLAGVLAALTLLKLEDDLTEDSLAVLNDMEKGAKRCKKLIEVFLGFSRLEPANVESDSLESSLDQSLSLLRSRMVESNLKMNIDYSEVETFSRPLNSSIASMIFYLILSEGFTLCNHQKLLISDLNQINVQFEERRSEMNFTFSIEIKLFEQLQNSKLFLHLLNVLGIDLEGKDGQIILRNYGN
jgi:hypothetical protein